MQCVALIWILIQTDQSKKTLNNTRGTPEYWLGNVNSIKHYNGIVIIKENIHVFRNACRSIWELSTIMPWTSFKIHQQRKRYINETNINFDNYWIWVKVQGLGSPYTVSTYTGETEVGGPLEHMSVRTT